MVYFLVAERRPSFGYVLRKTIRYDNTTYPFADILGLLAPYPGIPAQTHS